MFTRSALTKLGKTQSTKFGSQAVRAFASGTTFEKFDYKDPFNIDALLTDEERAISEAARAYA